MDNKEAVLEACKQIEEMDEASFNMDMLESWRKQKELGWRQMGLLGRSTISLSILERMTIDTICQKWP
jgi:hypothetical protein